MAEHLTIPGALEWDTVERHSIATLRYAGGKEHGVKYVSEVAYDALKAELKAIKESHRTAEPVRWERMSLMQGGTWWPCADKAEADSAVLCGWEVRPLFTSRLRIAPEFETWWTEIGEQLTKHEIGLKDLMQCAYETTL